MPVILRLAIPACPLRRLFDYLPPEHVDPALAAQLSPGCRLRVPFGKRSVVGYLAEVSHHSELDRASLRYAGKVLDTAPLLTPAVASLCRWAAAYYRQPPGDVWAAAFSKRLRAGKAQPRNAWRQTDRGAGLPGDALGRAPRQREALQLLATGPHLATALSARGITPATLRELARKGLAERCAAPAAAARLRGAGPVLGRDQAAVSAALRAALGGFSCHLLEGVTGSGKTEVYLQLISACVERGEQALVLVPEIGLTPQTLARFEERLDAPIALLHSGRGDGERSDAWDDAASGRAAVVIGTRSAVFTPLARCGAIIVDEEHDPSYRQQDGFRYSARDVAVKRGQLEQCPVVLGSATPSLESCFNAREGRYRHHQLRERAGGAAMPVLRSLDLRRQPLQAGLSPALLEAARHTLSAGQQVLLFLNRRGYASTLQCHDCGWIADCDHCDARLTVHRRRRRLQCHHCGDQRPLTSRCQQCGSGQLLTAGLGTEQTEEFLARALPEWPLHRVDSDAIGSAAELNQLLATIAGGGPRILIGTQMLTKGHHFPRVTLVGVIDSDALLFAGDFRGEERLAQLLTQVGGRAGRAAEPGEVLLQTHYPDHPLLQALLSQPYAQVAATLLERRIAAGMPPAAQLILLRADSPTAGAGEAFLGQLRRQAEPRLPAASRLIGPLPSALPRRAGRYRDQLLCISRDRGAGQRAADALVEAGEALRAPPRVNWFMDIDPLETQ